jgi:coenzyme F420-reducing hydrogenase delta subunit
MLVERLVLKEGADAKVYILADWSIVAEGHWAGNDFLKHKKMGARESCCEKLGKPEQLCIIPVLPLGSKRVKMLYLSRAEYDNLLELMDNIDVKVSPVKITPSKKGKAGDVAFVWCSEEENGMRIRSSVSMLIDLLQKEDFIDKITWPGLKYNDIGDS